MVSPKETNIIRGSLTANFAHRPVRWYNGIAAEGLALVRVSQDAERGSEENSSNHRSEFHGGRCG